MARVTSSSIFRDLVNSPIGLIAEYIVSFLSTQNKIETIADYIEEIQTGKTPPMSNPEYYESNDMEWIKPSDIGFEKNITGTEFISAKAIKANKATIYKNNTILIICIGGGIGRLGIVRKPSSSNQQITGILFNEKINPEFGYYFFLSRYKIFEANSSKSTLPIINQKALGKLEFICPKIEIQNEVVKFLEYCKICQNENKTLEKFDFKLDKKVIHFAIKAFSGYYAQQKTKLEITHQLTLLQNLNQAILQEAVQGKLVPQNPTDEPASQLLQRITAEKAQLGKKEKPLAPIKKEEIPFEIPSSWVWCRLRDLADIVRGGSPRPAGDKRYYDGEIPFLKVGDLTTVNDIYLHKHTHSIKQEGLYKTRFVEANTLLLTNSGATLGYPKIVSFPTTFNDGIAAFLDLSINKEYLFYFLKSMTEWYLKVASKGQGQPNLNTEIIGNTIFPLPPLSEQQRIVAEIEKQFAKTKQLKAHILANQQSAEQLLKALLWEAFK